MKLLCSACLLGIACRYDGQSKPSQRTLALLNKHELIPVCPEQLGGLPTPRSPCEIQIDGRLLSITGEDVTEYYLKGSSEAMKIYQLTGCQAAILKARSPACGKDFIYDGSFNNRLMTGNGALADLLINQGITVLSDEENFSTNTILSL